LAKVLFTRGDEISLPVGSRVEMVLQRPLTMQPTSSAKPNYSEETNHKPTIRKKQNTNQPKDKDNVSCLRDGVTFHCVDP
jgi:hypothetical protein